MRLIRAVAGCPDGVVRMSLSMPGLVQTSSNLARVVSDGETVKLQSLLRSSVRSEKFALGEAITAVFALAGAETELTGAYDGWNPDMKSPILKAMTASYRHSSVASPPSRRSTPVWSAASSAAKYPRSGHDLVRPTIQLSPLARREGGDRLLGGEVLRLPGSHACAMSLQGSAAPGDVKWFVIVNPVAGGGLGWTHFPQISKHLRDAHIRCEPVFTEHKFHATELTVTAVREGYRHIIVVGGDGTLHEVVNGLFIQQESAPPTKVLLAVVAVGTGNDWCVRSASRTATRMPWRPSAKATPSCRMSSNT